MPSMLPLRSDRFFFVLLDRWEPPPIQVRRQNMVAKFWLERIALEREVRLRDTDTLRAVGFALPHPRAAPAGSARRIQFGTR